MVWAPSKAMGLPQLEYFETSHHKTGAMLTPTGKPAGLRLSIIFWTINLASISASVLVYLYLAHYAYTELNSLIVSELVLLMPMLMPVLLVFQLNQITNRVPVRKLLVIANTLGLTVCAALFLYLPLNTWNVLSGAALLGTLDAIQRVARIVAIKQYFSSDEVRFTVPLTLTAQFIAGALAGAIIAFFPGQLTNNVVAIATFTLFTIAVASTVLIPGSGATAHTAAVGHPGLLDCLDLLRNTPLLKESLVSFVLLGTFFQGFYNISRVALPAHHLGLAQQYVGLLQMVASVSAVAGALIYYFLSKRGVVFKLHALYVTCALAMLLSCMAKTTLESYAMYFLYFFLFEIAFFRLQADIMTETPIGKMPLVATLQYALVYTGMMISIVIGAVLVKWFGLTVTAFLFALGFAASHAMRRPTSDRTP